MSSLAWDLHSMPEVPSCSDMTNALSHRQICCVILHVNWGLMNIKLQQVESREQQKVVFRNKGVQCNQLLGKAGERKRECRMYI